MKMLAKRKGISIRAFARPKKKRKDSFRETSPWAPMKNPAYSSETKGKIRWKNTAATIRSVEGAFLCAVLNHLLAYKYFIRIVSMCCRRSTRTSYFRIATSSSVDTSRSTTSVRWKWESNRRTFFSRWKWRVSEKSLSDIDTLRCSFVCVCVCVYLQHSPSLLPLFFPQDGTATFRPTEVEQCRPRLEKNRRSAEFLLRNSPRHLRRHFDS